MADVDTDELDNILDDVLGAPPPKSSTSANGTVGTSSSNTPYHGAGSYSNYTATPAAESTAVRAGSGSEAPIFFANSGSAAGSHGGGFYGQGHGTTSGGSPNRKNTSDPLLDDVVNDVMALDTSIAAAPDSPPRGIRQDWLGGKGNGAGATT